MYPSNQGIAVPQTMLGQAAQYATKQPMEPSTGIASRVESLQNVVSSTCQLVYSVSSALGIASPESNEKTQGPSSLAEVLMVLRNRLTSANNELEGILQHLNS